MICLSSITLIISSYEDRNQRRCLEDKKISLMFLEHLRTSSNNIYIFGEAGEICVFCDIQNNQILRQPHKLACIYIVIYLPTLLYLFWEFLSEVTAGIHNLIIWRLNQELHLLALLVSLDAAGNFINKKIKLTSPKILCFFFVRKFY